MITWWTPRKNKHWRACKRGALPNWAIALVLLIHILSYYVENFLSRLILYDQIFLIDIALVLLRMNILFIMHWSDRWVPPPLFFLNLLNSVVRVLLSYGGSHWFKSNSRYILLDTRVKGMVSNKFFYSSSFIDFVSFPSYSIFFLA